MLDFHINVSFPAATSVNECVPDINHEHAFVTTARFVLLRPDLYFLDFSNTAPKPQCPFGQ